LGKRGAKPTFTRRAEVWRRPETYAEVRQFAGYEPRALGRWIRQAVVERLERETKVAMKA
jgi:hypothetical protein